MSCHSISSAILDLYHNRSRTWNFDCAKAPGIDDRKSVHISNIDRLTIVDPRELSRESKSKLLTDCGIHSGLPLEVRDVLSQRGLQIQKLIGQGKQAIVYALADIQTGKVSKVLKVMNESVALNQERGAHLVAKIKHSTLCTPLEFIYEKKKSFFQTPKYLASIMPYIEGETFENAKSTIALQAESIFRFGALGAEGLYQLSIHELEHRDLHECNILINSLLEPIIIDFDLCTKTVYPLDRECFLDHLYLLIDASSDINPNAKGFLKSCVAKIRLLNRYEQKRIASDKHVPSFFEKSVSRLYKRTAASDNRPNALLVITFMQACLAHLDEIKNRPPVSKL